MMKTATVMWVGLSAKKATDANNGAPLHISTKTGKLIAEIETQCHHINFFKTNLVKFPPLDSEGKLRYPTPKECRLCYPELQIELQAINPHIILLLGNKTASFVLCQFGVKMPKLSYKYQAFKHEKRWYVPIHHPSHIMVYKQKDKNQYIQAVKTAIEQLIL